MTYTLGPNQKRYLSPRLALLMIFLLCVAAYLRGLFGSFIFDDFPNIVSNTLLQTVDGTLNHWNIAALSSGSGLFHRPISMLTFALNYYGFGMNPFAFKLVNLIIHLCSGGLIYLLCLRLIPRLVTQAMRIGAVRWLAVFVTGLWLLHPLNVSSVLYIVQRMNELSTLFMLAGLLCYVEGRLRTLRGKPGLALSIVGLTLFGILAVFSKENGALITAYALVIESICFHFESPNPRARTWLKAFFLLVVALPCTAFFAYILLNPDWLAHGYAVRNFTLTQRLLTEPRILFHYLQWVFLPWPAWMGLYHDDISVSTHLLNPTTTLFAMAAMLALMFLAWVQRRRWPGFAFAVAWFLVGHAMESTIIPLLMTFEHRNYLPIFGVLLGSVSALYPLAVNRIPKALPAISVVLLLGLITLTASRTANWNDPLRLAFTLVKDHPNSARSQYDAGRATVFAGKVNGNLHQARVAARPHFLRAMVLDKTFVFPATGLILTYAKEKTVPESAVTELRSRLKNAPIFFANTFLALINSITDGWVSLSPSDVKSLITAALDNPRTTPYARAGIFNAYGRYLFVQRHDKQAAIALTLSAAVEDPGNPIYQVNISKLAIALERPDIATEHLKVAESLDHAGLYQKEISSLNAQLRARFAAAYKQATTH